MELSKEYSVFEVTKVYRVKGYVPTDMTLSVTSIQMWASRLQTG